MVRDDDILLRTGPVPAAGAVLNPFVIVDDADGLVTFVCEVFGVAECAEASLPIDSTAGPCDPGCFRSGSRTSPRYWNGP